MQNEGSQLTALSVNKYTAQSLEKITKLFLEYNTSTNVIYEKIKFYPSLVKRKLKNFRQVSSQTKLKTDK